MEIPLTIKHTKEDLPFFKMGEANLGALLDIEFEKAFKRQVKIKNDWIKNKRCNCVENLKKGKVLRCEHIKKRLEEDRELQEIWNKIHRMSSASNLRCLYGGVIKSN